MSSRKCIDAYGNERQEGHVVVTGRARCARCGAPIPASVTNHIRKHHTHKES